MKKFLSILLVVVFIVTVVPLGTFDVEINALSTSGDCSYSHYNLGCDTDGICPYCGYRGPAPGHVFVETDDGYVCDVCGYILEAEEDTTVNGTLNGNDSVEVGETIELTVKVENCENATSVAVRLTLGDSFEFVSGSWLKSGSLNTFDTKTLKGALGGLTSPNVNGDLFKFVLKATRDTNGEDVTVNVIAKNGATEIMNTNAVKTVKVTEAEFLAPNCTLNGADSVDVGDTIELTVKVENCESATSLSVAVILSDSFELVSGQWIKSGSIMKFDLGTKKGALGGLASPDVNGDVLKFVLKATKVTDGEDVTVNVIAKNGSNEIMNVIATKTVNVIYVEPAGAISALNGNDSVEVGNTIELTVNVKDCENATSVAVAIALGDSFELVSGEWIKGGSIKMFDLSSKKGALGGLTSPNVNGDLFKFVLKATKVVANGEDVTVNVIAKNGSNEIMNVNAVKTVKVVCTNHIYNGCDAECNLCGYIREEIHTFTNECDRDCNLCGEIRNPPHKFSASCDEVCDGCCYGREASEPHIYTNACDADCDACGVIRTVDHLYTNSCDIDCNLCGAVRTITHTFTNECDAECDVCYETRKAPHKYDAICDAECNLCGKTRVAADHTYDNACDENCNECNEARTPPHYYSWVVDKENNCGVDGFKHEECAACHATQNENTIIPATGNHGFEWIVDKQNNCGVDGLKHEECVVCHTTRNNNVVVPATGDHTYDNACDAYCNVCNFERTVPDHVYSNPCDIDCNVCSSVRKAVHLFANNCDPECDLCGSIRAVPDHIYTDEYDSTCDECGYLRVTPGNVDGDDEINDSDVEYLLMFTFFPEEYPVNQNCDFDGDGEVNDQDAGYLLMFIFFPEDYPLYNK